ncbi:MAG: hypothetical protein LBU08_04320 [Tannerellaceae bacterium]|jgi:hypothetical protein|nr:hypothetical protein [Tannerellaceae bacterium]
MNKVKVFIEGGYHYGRKKEPYFSAYVDDEDKTLPYGIFGEGRTPAEAAADFISAYDGMRQLYEERGEIFVEAFFEFHKDYEEREEMDVPGYVIRNDIERCVKEAAIVQRQWQLEEATKTVRKERSVLPVKKQIISPARL